ncbi:MAG TPA: PIG-L deacetylase family protein [Flavisolibacter sp.]|jgi:LmbE family N-acetylglucosaminyl deacetylase|nr:PIG-L deacetylase family protein [Flavisolibacter sp.]
MQITDNSRRNFVKKSLGSLGFITLPAILHPQTNTQFKKSKIVVVGGHPDDPECGCGGTVARLSGMGHDVTLMYFTNGDEGINGKSNEEAAEIRKKESIESCKVLGARPVFVGQVDGETVLGNPEMAKFEKILYEEKPEIVFTHWPIDSHKDHQLASVLTIQSWMEAQEKFSLYFYEVCTGNQSFGFHPTDYVDISDFEEHKIRALACHASQDIVVNGKYTKNMIDCGHPAMQEFRGRELGVRAAEAFIKMTGHGKGQIII